MMYAEMAYFDKHPCKHVADWQEYKRLKRLRAQADRAYLKKG